MKTKNKSYLLAMLVMATICLIAKNKYWPPDEVKIHRIVEFLQNRKGSGVEYIAHQYIEGTSFLTEVSFPDNSHYVISSDVQSSIVYIRNMDESCPWFTIAGGELLFASEDAERDKYPPKEFKGNELYWKRKCRDTLSSLYHHLSN